MTDETLNRLQAFVLPWAKEHHSDWYELTLKVAKNRESYEAYLVRLLECRWDEDPTCRATAPIDALEETKVTVRLKDGERVLEFSGKKVKHRRRAVIELLMPKEEWEALERTREILDLEYE